jgi:putative membrane protein
MAAMNSAGQLAALIAALIHVAIFAMESLLFPRPEVRGRFHVGEADVAAVRPWAFNQGFYNLFLAVGTIAGLALLHTGGYRQAGTALVVLACASMLGAALVLIGTDRRMARAALLQGLLPLIALLLLIFS